MTFKFITASSVFVTAAVLASSVALAVTPVPPRKLTLATPAAELRQQAAARSLAMVARLQGNVVSIGTSSFVVNGVTVNVAANTVLLRRFGAKSSLSEFSVGDQVQIFGKWTDDTKTAINARLVRNQSIQKRHGTFVGTIQSLSATGFVLIPVQRSTQTVTVNTKTKYVDRGNRLIAFSGLAVGQKVRASGMWDNKLNTITETDLVKDYSLPVVTPNVTPKTATSSSGLPQTQYKQNQTPGTSQ